MESREEQPLLKLTTTSYIVLGMIRLRGPSTSYDLKRAVGKSLGYFWPFPHAQLYREPARLAAAGLLAEVQEIGGRNRRVYTITSAGEQALHTWLNEPVHKIQELRDLAQLKLFFSEVMTTEELLTLAREQIVLHQARLAEYEAMEQRYRPIPALSHRLAPLGMGLLLERASITFWTTLLDNLTPTEPSERGAKGAVVEAGYDHEH